MPAQFTPESMRFLRGLTRHNDRAWFEQRRPVYERSIREPLLALIEEINAGLHHFAPEHVRPAHKVAMRIFRDTRFSPDKRPYKTHVAAWWARQGLEKRSAAGFFCQLGPAGGFLAAAVYAPDRDDLRTLRLWLAEHHERFRATLHPLLAAAGELPAMQAIEPNALTRNPQGFAADHPASDLLRARNWGVTVALTAESALSATLGGSLLSHFRRAAPLVHLLNEPFLQSAARPAVMHRR